MPLTPHEIRAIAELNALMAEAAEMVRRNDREIARLRQLIADLSSSRGPPAATRPARARKEASTGERRSGGPRFERHKK